MSEEKKEIIKEYSNEEITVVWKPNSCSHSKKCWNELTQVFDPRNRPWVNMDGATSERIKKQVNACPSGALSLKVEKSASSSESNAIEVKCIENGPLMIHGNVHITNSDGSTEIRENRTTFCRCGVSQNKPYCDGAHRSANFIG